MEKRKVLLLICGALLVSGCSGTYLTHYENLKIAFAKPYDATPSIEMVKSSEVDFALVKNGDRPFARMALAYQENGKNKWVSADNGMLINKAGHIVKTVGLKNDLIYVSDTDTMPLSDIDQLGNIQWKRYLDWQTGEYGHEVVSTFDVKKSTTNIEIMNHSFESIMVVEKVRYAVPSSKWKLQNEWENHFWFDTKSGLLLKSSQQVSPFSERVEVQYISRAVRLM